MIQAHLGSQPYRRFRAVSPLILALTLAALACQSMPLERAAATAPEPSGVLTTGTLGQRGEAEHGMVVSAHPLASEAGLEMLRRGGNAVDAAVAAAFAVGVVEPMMGGIGGSGGMLIWRQADRRTEYLDFYARAPAGTDPETAAVRADPARLVAVPGAVKGLLAAHDSFGRLETGEVIAPAIRLAEDGFRVSSLLARTVAADSAKLMLSARVQELFWPDMRPLGAGEWLVQPELAVTLRRIAGLGAAGFHEGPVAEEIIRVVRPGGNPMTMTDLAEFEPTWRRPVCGTFRGTTVLSAPPPQAGFQVVQTLHMLDAAPLAALGWPTASPAAFHALIGALRVGIADRQAYLGDPGATPVPAVGLTAPAYANARRPGAEVRARIEPGDPWDNELAGPTPNCAPFQPVEPASGHSAAWGAPPPAGEDEGGETTHLSVVDSEGNAVSLTFTQGAYFGSGMWAAGTFLNNAMAIFSSDPESPNALRPGARPASTTTPTIIIEEDRVRLVVGSPGGGRIPPAVIQAIVYVVEYGLDPFEALRMPRVQPQFSTPVLELEQGFAGALLGEARDMGYEPAVLPPLSLYFGGVHMIERRGGRWIGAADPRRDGQVRGY